MARGAARLHLVAAQEWELPQMDFAMGLFDAVDGNALAFMAASATKPIRRMRIVGEQHFTPRVGLEWISFLLEASSIDRHMASLAAIDARHRLIEAIAVELIEGNLLDFGDFEESHGTELKRHVLLYPDPFVPLAGHFGKFILDFLGAGLDLFDLFL